MKRIAVLLGFLLVVAAGAQTYPARPDGSFVADGAGLLKEPDKADITLRSRSVLKTTGAPIVVATVPSLASVGAQAIGIEAYAHKLFDTWGIGSKHANHGILLLVAKDDHKARIELGKDWEHRYDPDSHRIMVGTIIPRFKQGDYSAGIRDGVRDLDNMLRTAAAETPGSAAPAMVDYQEGESSDDSSSSIGSFAAGFGGVMLIFFGIFAIVFISVIITFVNRMRGISGPLDWTRPRRYGAPYDSTTNVWIDPGTNPGYTNPSDIGIASSYDSSSSSSTYDSSSSSSSDSGGGFDSGSSGGGGDSGSW
ncbi:TPM domain-containing protein [Fimbriimonas ginsengisoli]|uniref:TPM domain-containing protein n=1 Tax=Fimbriimonas ginsengisoli Gsoil 348 TaxID=661478 RepID=A0A068NQS5_FIMGI|nr:TPM domain-containing protein [Fimbriimonas ginsengisoli]AIE85796.1 hypothetical protein OP10G_2428 [Fimbriimonas ginsengisoli Gsoil 348]